MIVKFEGVPREWQEFFPKVINVLLKNKMPKENIFNS